MQLSLDENDVDLGNEQVETSLRSALFDFADYLLDNFFLPCTLIGCYFSLDWVADLAPRLKPRRERHPNRLPRIIPPSREPRVPDHFKVLLVHQNASPLSVVHVSFVIATAALYHGDSTSMRRWNG